MIKPQNDQAIPNWTIDFWRKEYQINKTPRLPNWVCDCCGKASADMEGWRPPFGTVCVSGLTYLGCSIDCVRALFTIHHQYALSEILDVKLARPVV
jgi:hypothetical protein